MKLRHVKTFQEKYGIRSVLSAAVDFIANTPSNQIRIVGDELFGQVPYLGYLRVPFEFHEFYGETATDSDTVNVKVVEVTEDSVVVLAYDSHCHQLIWPFRVSTAPYVIRGNVLERAS